MQAISLCWFAAQQQTNTLRRPKIGLFYVKFNAEFNELSLFFLKATGSGQKMTRQILLNKLVKSFSEMFRSG